MKIIVRRSGALGDVVLATPIVRRLRRENPDATIVFETAYPDVLKNNQFRVTATNQMTQVEGDRFINLDLAYERRPDMHIVEAYMLEAFGDAGRPAERQQDIVFDRRPLFSHDGPYIAVHAAQAGWRNRTLPSATWLRVIRRLQKERLMPILVGSVRDDLPGAQCASFLSMDIASVARLIASCACFVGSDSGLLHVAGATATPIAGVFTCARPEYRLPWRNGVLGKDCTAIVPELDCVGCLARAPVPTTVETCERGDVACVSAVSPEEIVDAVLKLVG